MWHLSKLRRSLSRSPPSRSHYVHKVRYQNYPWPEGDRSSPVVRMAALHGHIKDLLKNRDTDNLKSLLRDDGRTFGTDGTNCSCSEEAMLSVLLEAVNSDDYQVIDSIHAEINLDSSFFEPVLHAAIVNDKLEILHKLRWLNLRWSSGTMNLALRHGNRDIVIWMDANGCCHNQESLELAVKYGYPELVRSWILGDNYIGSAKALQLALCYRQFEVADTIRELGCPVPVLTWSDYLYYTLTMNWKAIEWIQTWTVAEASP